MQKTNNEKVLRHYVVPLGPKKIMCQNISDDICSLRHQENVLRVPDNNTIEYHRVTLEIDKAMEVSSKDSCDCAVSVRNDSCNYFLDAATSRCKLCLRSEPIESELNCCKLLSTSVYGVVRRVFNVTDISLSNCTDRHSASECNSEEVVCNASECSSKREYDGRCCGGVDVRHCPAPHVGDGDSARVQAAGGLRKELSMLTVLLALMAIARSKCVLLSTPSARQWITSAIVWCMVFGCVCTPTAAQMNVARQEKVCQSVDIRNSVQRFDLLRGCTVVEGFVQILLIDHANETSYANISFPELREITGYLLLYRATGLRSVGKIFPNLAVIRGNTLFYNYALVAFEMVHLQEIGLHSLTDIVRGGVRFEKNPLLCYVETIDWDLIAKEAKGDLHFISGNRRKNECPMCPTSESGEGPCQKSPITNQPLCWNRHHCQKVCPKDKCVSSCNANGSCCHENCLGSCFRPHSQDDCFVCKDVSFRGKCIKKCPPDTYEYMKRRCVDESECYSMPAPKEQNWKICQNTTWKPFRGSGKCVLECPSGTEEKMSPSGKMQCLACQGACRIECPGVNVDSIASAQRLRGCTYIKGSIEIQITGGKNIVKELEDNLNMIEEIEGYLKVVRSFPLISLNFLKNLRVIHGKLKLESDKYALVVLDNQNLQELWGSKQLSQPKIKNGRIFFHFNPKLCVSVIQQMSRSAGISEPLTELEVAHNSNGDKVACNMTELNATVKVTSAQHVLISWEKFDHFDHRSLLGYVVYFTEAPNQTLSLYDGRDACGSDGWRVDDVGVDEDTHLLTFLKPYTQYAFYVKTYTIATENSGAQSPILYFRTDPDTPSVPHSVKVYSNSSTELVIKWRPPTQPNGNVTHYIITGTRESEEQSILEPRNYCHEPITQEKKTLIAITDEEEDKTKDASCSCEEKKEKKKLEEDDIIFANHFEDVLQNQVYVKQLQHRCSEFERSFRERRSVSSSFGMDAMLSTEPPSSKTSTSTNKPDINITVYGANTVVLTKLHHFTQYTIWIVACREPSTKEKSKNITRVCSKQAMVTDRTLARDGADDIRFLPSSLKMSNESRGTNGKVEITWLEPPQPNGIIVTYQIEYRRVDSENFKPTVECITRDQFKKLGSYTLTGLNPGNYSLQLRATSLAGYGAYTPVTYFLVQEETTTNTEVVIGGLIGTILIILIFGTLLVYYRRKYVEGVPKIKLIASVNPEYMSTVYVPDEWEVPRNKVKLLWELGQGSFGMVYEGIASDVVEGTPEKRCAVKTVNEHATDRERSEFLNEASVMKAFNTHHVVRLLGVVSQGQPVLVIMELMTNGDLKTYLRNHRPDSSDDPSIQPPTLKRILQMAIEITDGMAYLAAKKFVHRDLASRNCMVADDLTVKIGDFGMTRDIYETDYYRKGTKGLLPVRWMAPESLKDGVFTSRSDVWSYGVVLWEMATLASQPYQGLSNDQVLRYVIDGGVMERPENCPDRLYELMRLCWQHKPTARPSFLDLVAILLADVPNDFQQVSFYHSTEGCELRAHMAEAEQLEDDPATPLRARDLEDFTLGGSDEEEETFRVTNHSPSTNFPRFISTRPSSTTSSTNLHGDQVVIALPTNGNKLGNGSAVSSPTSPTTANGWIPNRQNGTDTAHSSNSALRTTQC